MTVRLLCLSLAVFWTGRSVCAVDVMAKFAEYGVVPDVLAKAPDALATVSYGSHSVNLGNELKPDDTKTQPTTLSWDASSDALYTVIMTDPDAPSRANPVKGEWRHWLVVNVRGHDLSSGHTLTNYMGPGPPPKTGLHRYVFLVYKQNGSIQDTEWSDQNRPNFKAAKFAEKHGLGDPVAGNFFQAKNAQG